MLPSCRDTYRDPKLNLTRLLLHDLTIVCWKERNVEDISKFLLCMHTVEKFARSRIKTRMTQMGQAFFLTFSPYCVTKSSKNTEWIAFPRMQLIEFVSAKLESRYNVTVIIFSHLIQSCKGHYKTIFTECWAIRKCISSLELILKMFETEKIYISAVSGGGTKMIAHLVRWNNESENV